MDEVGGAIEWIDDPDVVVFVVQVGGGTGLFSQDGVVGVGGFQNLYDCLFGGLVHFGYEVVRCFFRDLDAVQIEGCAIDNGSAAAGSLDRRIKHGMHRVSVKMAVLTPQGEQNHLN